MIRLTAQPITLDASADGEPSRQITGLAVPWNVKATLSGGESVVFLEGSLPEDGPMPKLLEYHDETRVIGRVTERVSTAEGMMFVAKLSATRAADDALALLADGALDSVSVGAVPTKFKRLADGTLEVSEAKFLELSVVTTPAYADAQVYSVAASSPEEEAPDEEEVIPTPTPTSEEDEMSEAIEASAVPTASIQYAAPKREFKLPTAAEYMVKFVAGGSEFAEFNARIHAAAPNVTTTDTPGILPIPIVSPIYNNFVPNYRPLVTAMGVRQMPMSGKVFIRPKVTTNTTIGASNGELVPLDQGTFVVDDIQITKALYGGYVKLSEESMDMTSPEVLGALIDDMARIYANATDIAACTTFAAGVTQTEALTDITDPADWVAFIYNSAEQILNNSNGNLPNVIVTNPAYYAALGALVDTAGRPLFPNVGPQNAVGTGASASTFNGNAFGLSLVVDRNLTAAGVSNLYVGDSTGFECWEQQKGAVSVELADGALGRIVKFRGYFSSVMMDATKFVRKA
jgi:HK97 family phage prohead protease/HK97 family phage major capsid protein